MADSRKRGNHGKPSKNNFEADQAAIEITGMKMGIANIKKSIRKRKNKSK